jgi:hypothetical protein
VPTSQLLVYTFAPGAKFEGQLVGALERIESGGAIRILDALFVTRAPDTGELAAVSLKGGAGGVLSQLLEFRLNPDARGASTERALAGPEAELVAILGGRVQPGAAVAAVLVEHAWAKTLGEAVARLEGTEATSAFVEAEQLSDVAEPVLAAAENRP